METTPGLPTDPFLPVEKSSTSAREPVNALMNQTTGRGIPMFGVFVLRLDLVPPVAIYKRAHNRRGRPPSPANNAEGEGTKRSAGETMKWEREEKKKQEKTILLSPDVP